MDRDNVNFNSLINTKKKSFNKNLKLNIYNPTHLQQQEKKCSEQRQILKLGGDTWHRRIMRERFSLFYSILIIKIEGKLQLFIYLFIDIHDFT